MASLPVPWRRMAWVTWRQHRATLGAVAVFLGAFAAYLWLTGLQIHGEQEAGEVVGYQEPPALLTRRRCQVSRVSAYLISAPASTGRVTPVM
jgi:hypothetical protein